ncbi:MAG: DUF1015 domain-containing protein [Candidatus Omnitrophota bacterium]|nr:DUF1015 domain-containing protein [Candidatus Omnitrophota bacterium]
MDKIRPFKAVFYNQDKIGHLSKVVCPPYDIISSNAQERYHKLHPNNLIHILFGKDMPGEDKYQRAAKYLKDWLKDGILIQDENPAIYFYSHQYNLKGEKRTRLGFISLLRLGDNSLPIFKHEHTRLAPKEDRFKLLKETKANLSPIFVVFKDKKRIINRIFQKYLQNEEPFINITDEEKNIHKIWRVSSPQIIDGIQKSMSGEDVFIADGHHRYEVACNYRQELIEKLGREAPEENFNFILSYFTNTDPRGLTILAVHRLLKLDPDFDFSVFKSNLRNYFDVEEVKGKQAFFLLMEKGGRGEHVLGMYKDKKYYLLRLKNIKLLDKMIDSKSKEFKSLDVSILNVIILKKLLGLSIENNERLAFSSDAQDFISCVDREPSYLAFFLNPVKIQQITSVALNGEKMPSKSTYFYPKVLSGLVINKHE